MGERVTVEGTVENVIFHNEENGYTVLLLTVEGEEEPVTVVGCIPCAAAGEGMTVTGVWSVHPVHGSQLTAESVERRMPEREEDMIAYLSSGILKGVGPATAQRLVERFGGKLPDNMEDLLSLPGVGRKTANLILGDIYGKDGYVCDTHCIRITGRLGLTDGSKDPLKVEQQLRKVIPPEEANNFCHRMVLHGRALCMARKPDCENCALRALCDYGSTAER